MSLADSDKSHWYGFKTRRGDVLVYKLNDGMAGIMRQIVEAEGTPVDIHFDDEGTPVITYAEGD